jgi:hypothetical protein
MCLSLLCHSSLVLVRFGALITNNSKLFAQIGEIEKKIVGTPFDMAC